MQHEFRLFAALLVGGTLCQSAALGQGTPRMGRVIKHTVPVTTTQPAQGPAADTRIPARPVLAPRQLKPGIFTDRPNTQVAVRPVADCAAKPTVEYGEMTAGKRTTIRFVEADGTRRQTVAVINGEPVYRPDPAAANRVKPIGPHLRQLSITYHKVLTGPAGGAMRSGWYASSTPTTSLGTIIKDNRDGTAEVILPDAPDAMFAQQATLSVVTDRCTITAPIAIRPPMHAGRWFPPTMVAQCMRRYTPKNLGFGVLKIDSNYSLEQSLPSSRPIADAYRPNALFHNCGPDGAVHEGGSADGAGMGTGVDQYIVWDGGFDPNFTVLVAKFSDEQGQSCVSSISRVRRPDGGGYIGTPATQVVAPAASRSALEVTVTWRITKPHGYCWYALVAKGRHPVSLGDTWETRFSRNNLGIRSSMVHSTGKTELFWLKDIGGGRGQPQSMTAAF